MLTLQQIKFCAEECNRQQSGELSVYWMCEALVDLQDCLQVRERLDLPLVTENLILALARTIEPVKNRSGYRFVPVTMPGLVVLRNQEQIPREMSNLIRATHENLYSPEEFYDRFETIHPFIDGNGRVGALLYNLLNDTLENPITPPEYKR